MYDVLYRRGLTPWVAAGHAQSALIERLLAREESWHGAAAGRTLVDLGCGTGEHSLAAATRGWTVVGIDASAVAIDRARRAAAASGLDVRFVAGDVRRLTDVPGLRPGVSVFVDVGCHHGLRAADRRLVADGVARLAASRASLLVVGMDRRPGLVGVGVTAEGLAADFPGWRVEPGQTFELGGRGLLRRVRFRVFRLVKGDPSGGGASDAGGPRPTISRP